jgi:hypothetical protein
MKTASDFYLAFLPLLNAGRVELLDSPRLVNQLAALERRRGRGGRDTIDHAPGGHDDAACAAAGALTLAAIDGAPSLIRREHLDAGDEDLTPRWIAAVTAVMVVDPSGRVGLAYFASPQPGLHDAAPAWLLDFEMVHFGPGLFGTIAQRIDEFAEEIRARKPAPQPVHCFLFLPEHYQPIAIEPMERVFRPRILADPRKKVHCDALEDVLDRWALADGVKLHAMASAYTVDRVKVTARAKERMATLPLGIFAGLGDPHDPVTSAFLIGVILHFGGERSSADPGWPGAQLVHA